MVDGTSLFLYLINKVDMHPGIGKLRDLLVIGCYVESGGFMIFVSFGCAFDVSFVLC